MAYLSVALVILLSLANGLFSVARAGQDETCTMDDKEHKAHYHCPTDYEVVYTGEGTKVCDGKCFKKGDKKSLREAVGELLQRQGLTPMVSTAELDRSVDQLASTGKVLVPTARGAGKNKRGRESFLRTIPVSVRPIAAPFCAAWPL